MFVELYICMCICVNITISKWYAEMLWNLNLYQSINPNSNKPTTETHHHHHHQGLPPLLLLLQQTWWLLFQLLLLLLSTRLPSLLQIQCSLCFSQIPCSSRCFVSQQPFSIPLSSAHHFISPKLTNSDIYRKTLMTRTRISWPYRWGSKPFPSSFIFLENSPLPAKSSNTWKTFESALALPSNTRIMTLHMDFQELSTTRCICPCPRLIPTFIFWRFECWVQGTSGGASNQFSNVREEH